VRSATLAGPSRRLQWLCVLLLLGFVVLAARAAHLTVFDLRGKGWGERQIRTVLRLPAPRGLIVDRRGVELAVTLQAPSIYVVPRDVEDPDHTARALAKILGHDSQALAKQLRHRRRFTFVKRWASREEAAAVTALELPGVGILKEPRRAYPAGALAGQLIGFANIDGVGVRAIEQQENRTLRGHERTVIVERDARGRLLVVDPALPRDTAGGDVRLTLDATLQASAEGALAGLVERTGSRGGAVVTLDPKTGDILSLAEYPPTDPNVFRSVDFPSTRSKAFLDAVEPGSTLKVFLMAGALDAQVVRPDEMIETGDGKLRVPGKVIRDHHGYGLISAGEALQVSSNVAAVMIGQRLEPRRHYEVLQRFGFGRSTSSGFPQESSGLLRHWRNWKPIDHATISFGQGINVTPIQLAAAAAALANDGIWQKPRLVDAYRKPGGEWEPTPREVGHRAVSSVAAAQTLRMMESVVSASGTGRLAALSGVRVAGKTGTAQKFDSEAGRYSRTDYLAWFIGAVPADDPSLVIAIVIDEPQGPAHGGGDHAAPLFAKLAAAQLAHQGIVTEPVRLRPERFRTLLAETQQPEQGPQLPQEQPTEQTEQRKPEQPRPARVAQAASPASVKSAASPASHPASLVTPKIQVPAAPQAKIIENPPVAAAPPPSPDVAAAPPEPSAATPARRPSAASSASRLTAPEGAHTRLVPDFRGETLAAAMQMAKQDSLELELEGDPRGLAVEQEPGPGTVLTGIKPRVLLRFTQDSLTMDEG
jgi:cell division protein FtsI (penicillin-binding protein 3)